jgi:hypothetical protein
VDATDRDDYWLAAVDPPFIGQRYGLGASDISEVILATKFAGHSLFDERRIIPVSVARIVDGGICPETLRPEQIEVILWCAAKPIA